jgi:aminomethyltransferase
LWSGYWVASSYDVLHDYEYYAIRSTAGLIDVSPLYKYELSGKDAERFLNRIVTRDVSRCAVNQAMYTCLCDEEGKVIQDGTVFRLAADHFLVNLADPSYRWFQLNTLGLDVKIEDISESVAALAVQGPLARALLKPIVADADLEKLGFFRLASAKVGDIPAIISRTGYTGDLGYELWIPSRYAERLWDTVTEAGKNFGLTPAGMLALDMARIEAGFILIEVDYSSVEKAFVPSQTYSPFEIGLDWTVSLDKNHFVGRKALLDEKNKGPSRRTVGLELDYEDYERLYREEGLAVQVPTAAWRGGVPVYKDSKQVGRATSGTWSPILKKYIALATLDAPFVASGTEVAMEVTVEYRRKKARAAVVKPPFFDPERKRK